VNLAIRFLLTGKDINSTTTTSQYINQYWKQNFYSKNNLSTTTEKLMHDWFALMDLEKFKIKYPIDNSSVDDQSKELEALHINWVEDSMVTHTPKFFINGYELPKDYSIEDLMVLVPGLADHFIKTKIQIKEPQLVNV
jgi:protein-disulfide isomerase